MDLVVAYTATVFEDDETESCGPLVQLRADGNGVAAPGMGFLIQPDLDELFYIQISWNFTASPPGTRAVCTFGGGPPVSIVATPSRLGEIVFGVGQLHSFPEGKSSLFGLHWSSTPPFGTIQLGRSLESLVSRTASFFGDPSSLIRIFVRRVQTNYAAGNAFYRSFMFAWSSNSRDERSGLGLFEFPAHQMTHIWAIIEPANSSLENVWFNEGIAEFYSVVLPSRFVIYSRATFIERMNL